MVGMMTGNIKGAAAALIEGGSEAQERAGQIEQSFKDTLPEKMMGCTRADFEKLGFKFLGKTDKIFWECQFPPGWRKKPTNHSMWSDLLDDKGRKRGSIFFKAAFYDYDAHIGLNHRYGVKTFFLDAKKEEIYDRQTGEHAQGKEGIRDEFVRVDVIDQTTNASLFTTEIIERADWNNREEALSRSKRQDLAKEECNKWLDEHYPQWREASAYWD